VNKKLTTKEDFDLNSKIVATCLQVKRKKNISSFSYDTLKIRNQIVKESVVLRRGFIIELGQNYIKLDVQIANYGEPKLYKTALLQYQFVPNSLRTNVK